MRKILGSIEFVLLIAYPLTQLCLLPSQALALDTLTPDTLLSSPEQASGKSVSTQQTFIISASDGYGISDCLSAERSCGKIVADAWCEAHGRARALAYGLASDITASIPAPKSTTLGSSPAAQPQKDAIVITCAN
jgi:hypothetical protein